MSNKCGLSPESRPGINRNQKCLIGQIEGDTPWVTWTWSRILGLVGGMTLLKGCALRLPLTEGLWLGLYGLVHAYSTGVKGNVNLATKILYKI